MIPAFFATTLALLFFRKLREIALFLIVCGTVLSLGLSIHYFGAEWYRGTSRGFEVTFVDILASALLVSVMLDRRERKLYWPASLAPLLLFTFWAALTVAIVSPWIFGSYELFKMLRGLVLFLAIAFFVRDERRISIVLAGLAVAVLIQSTWALHQWYSGIFRVTGTLDHANSLSMYLCLVTPVLVGGAASTLPPKLIRHLCWIAAAAAVPTILLTLSRTGLPVFALVVVGSILWCVSWRSTPRKAIIALFVLIFTTGMVARSWEQIEARYGEATLGGEYFDEESEGRGFYFRQASVILNNRPLGVGLNNWSYIVSKEFFSDKGMRYQDYDDLTFSPGRGSVVYSGAYAPPAHNLGLITLGEMGWVGFILLTVLWIRWFHVGLRNALASRQNPIRYVSVGILLGFLGLFLQSLTEWTFRQTEIYMTFSFLLGTLAALHQIRKESSRQQDETFFDNTLESS